MKVVELHSDTTRDCSECPYEHDASCIETLFDGMLELLKEQEPVKPRFVDGKRNHFIKCGNCNLDLMSGMKFCPHCGKMVKWE